MDHQRDSGWIEPLEATALSADEETDTQTPVSIEADLNWTRSNVLFAIRRRRRGRTIMRVEGVSYDSPPNFADQNTSQALALKTCRISIIKLSKVRARKRASDSPKSDG